MNVEDFELIVNETIVNSIVKRVLLKIYHQQAANLNDSGQNMGFLIIEKKKYHQIGNAYLQYEKRIEKDAAVATNRVHVNGDEIRLVFMLLHTVLEKQGYQRLMVHI